MFVVTEINISDNQTSVNNKMHIDTDYFTGVGQTIYIQDKIDWLGYLVVEPDQCVRLSGGGLGCNTVSMLL